MQCMAGSNRESGPSGHSGSIFQGPFRATHNAVDAVLGSTDVLPLVLNHLKGILEHQDASGWKKSFSSVILTNKAFFESGIAILWYTMDSLTPCLALLPWFNRKYRGIGVYNYTGAKDWERFSLYARQVKHLEIEDNTDDEVVIHGEWLVQLLNLPGRPDPLFPALRHIGLASIDKPYYHLLPLTVGQPLRHLDVGASSKPYALFSVFPTLPYKCLDLTKFEYDGPSSPELFLHLARVKTLSSISFYLTSDSHQRDIAPIRRLPNLKSLKITAKRSEIVYDATIPIDAAGTTLQTLSVNGSGATQMSIQRAIRPSSRHIDLAIYPRETTLIDIYSVLRHCFSLSSRLLTMNVAYSGPNGGPNQFPNTQAATATKLALTEGARNLQQLKMLNLPVWAGEPLSMILQSAIPRWKSLEKLSFHVQTDQAPTGYYERPYPSFSFLATIQKECPHLQEFEFHFDDDVAAFDYPMNAGEDDPVAHPLRLLRIHTSSQYLALSVGEQSRIAMYLDQLFPSLEQISGTANGLWRDVGVLAQSYQAIRARFSRPARNR